MQDLDIPKYNQMICDFEGYLTMKKRHFSDGDENEIIVVSELRYHESWDWIMPVIDKIELLGWQVIIQKHHCEFIHESYPKIDYGFANKSNTGKINRLQICYKTIIDFIKYFNECNGNFYM